MRQVVQNVRSGKVELKTVPVPACGRGEVLVRTRASLISAGTERMVMEFAGKSLAGKAKERPDLVQKVVAKMQRDGVADTLKSVFMKLDEPLPLGYSAAGEVVAVGSDLAGEFAVGDRVAVAGAGLANHADYNAVPKNLCVALPDNVGFEHGCYATLGAIALNGVRQAGVVLGDRVLVIGLGLVGQLVSQLAAAAGARVCGLDYSPARCALAGKGGAKLTLSPSDKGLDGKLRDFTDGRGFDSILICAATDTDGPITNAADWARDRATVVLVGKVGTRFPYAAYMKKELTVKTSRSYGPGRYDPAFEQQGVSYPVGFVPWTERENLGEVVRLMGIGKLNVAMLTTHTFDMDDALNAYSMLKKGGDFLGVVLGYEGNEVPLSVVKPVVASGSIGVIGTGNFARGMLLPGLAAAGATIGRVVSKGGLSAAACAETYNAVAGTDADAVLKDKNIGGVVIATRHNLHAKLVLDALKAGKHVWVEKPLALKAADLDAIEKAQAKSGTCLMVGFNRRFAPHVRALKARLDAADGGKGPRQVVVRVNAGRLDDGNWQSGTEGGGRLLGEACHFTDLALYLAGSKAADVSCVRGKGQDNYVVTLKHANGSVSVVVYSSDGDSAAPKERVEVLASGGIGVMDNYTLTTWSQNGRKEVLARRRFWEGQDKGHRSALAAWAAACKGGDEPIAVDEVLHSSHVIVRAAKA